MNVLIFFLLSILVIAAGLSFGIVAVRIVDIIDEVASEDGSIETYLEKFNYSFTNRANVFTRRAQDTVNNVDTTAKYYGYTGNYSLDYSGSLFDVINLTPRASFTGYWTGRSWINPEDSAKYRKARTSLEPRTTTITALPPTPSCMAYGCPRLDDLRVSAMCCRQACRTRMLLKSIR